MAADSNPRASPDALLARANKEARGHLKIFLGAAPGVGKTYAMLTSARAARADGQDVVVGLAETHGRGETEALLDGIETLPRKPIVYRNQVMREFDLDAALARRPGLLLVDEYAHTNVPGSRHPKRWQDIDELLAAGIDVWTTLNIQHLESLNDVVQKITRVRVRETVPDSVFDRADELVLVDLPPDELLKRLAEGRVYVQDTAARAVESFFKPQNLTALRELAMRRAAARIDTDLIERMQAQAIEGPWAAGERILACVGADAQATPIVRTAKRLADLLDAPWIAVTVERPAAALDDVRRRSLDDSMALATMLGAETRTLVGSDLPAEILRLARFENATQIVVGRSRRGALAELFRRSLPNELVRRADGIAVHVVTAAQERTPAAANMRFGSWKTPDPMPFVWSAMAVAVAIAVGRGLSALIPLPNLSLVFLMAVLLPAIAFGIWPAIFASVLSFLAYNFFFIEPLYTFTVAEPYELLALVAFLVVAVITSALAGRVREQARIAAERVRATRRLFEFTRRLSGLAGIDAVAEGAASEIHASLRRPTIVLVAADKELTMRAAWPPEDALDTASMSAARWAFAHDEPAGRNTGTLPLIPWFFVPLRSSRGTIGAIGIATGEESLDSETRVLLNALAEQTATALERASLAREMVNARTATETERVRNILLTSISHDFRTPLASILGSATSLIDYGDKLDAGARRDLLGQIREDTEQLDRMVRNLLAMTRIEAGALELHKDWIDLHEIVDRVISTARRRGAAQHFDPALPPDLPLVRADAILAEQALGNVIGNAVKHTQPDARVRITADVDAGAVAIAVVDDGPGIPVEVLPLVFEKFVRIRPHSGDGDKGDGIGLGLAIAKGIMEAHGGTISADSPVAAGRGTRVMLTFPREAS